MFSHQPGARIPRRCGPFPARDDYVAYLQDYAAGMRLRLGTRVHRVDRGDAGWELTLAGDSIRAAHVVIATGPDAGAFTRAAADGVTVAVDDGFVRALKAGRVTMKSAIDRFDGPQVCFTDGTRCAPDAVICATGYRPGLEQLAGHLVALDALGMPPFTGACSSPAHPGLWFFGLDCSIYGNMHVRRRQARQLARAIGQQPAAGHGSAPQRARPAAPPTSSARSAAPAATTPTNWPSPQPNSPAGSTRPPRS